MCKANTGCVPVLVGKTCGSPPSVPNAAACPAGPFPVGHTHNYTCNVHYSPLHESYTTCHENGTWTNVLFRCQHQCLSMDNTVVIGTSWCYFISNREVTYDTAKAECTLRGMEMPIIESQPEWNALLEHIGAYANNTGSVREWFWENHQKIGLFRPWADRKPDNDMDTESDFVIATYRRSWDDVSPGVLKHLMCEKN